MGVCPEAEKITWEAIAARQVALPDWVVRNAISHLEKVNEVVWRITISLFRKRALGPGEQWERRDDGSKMLVSINPETGEERVEIDHAPQDEDRIDLFKVEVNLTSKCVVFFVDTNLASVDPGEFELYYEDL